MYAGAIRVREGFAGVPAAATARAQADQLVQDAFTRLDTAINKLASIGWFSTDYTVPLYRTQAADLRAYYAKVETYTPGYYSDPAAQRWFITRVTQLAEQVDASAQRASVSFWDGFWTNLGQRYVELLQGVPTAREILDWSRWVVPTVAIAVVAVVLAPVIGALARGRTLRGAKK